MRVDGQRHRVRVVAVDAPESSALRHGHAECGGRLAEAFLRELLPVGSRVHLSDDPTQDSEDRHGRWPRVARRGGRRTVQERLLRAGWTNVHVYDGRRTQAFDELVEAARVAKRHRRGIDALCGGFGRRARS